MNVSTPLKSLVLLLDLAEGTARRFAARGRGESASSHVPLESLLDALGEVGQLH